MSKTHFVNNFITAKPNFFKHAKGTKKDDLKVLKEEFAFGKRKNSKKVSE